MTRKKNFYLAILTELKITTNLTNIKKKLSLSKQQLNYYLRELKKKGFIYSKGFGWWELSKKGKNPTKYGIFLKEDSIRGHAYIWETEIESIPKKWNKRIEVLDSKGINYKLVGVLKTTPRIKVLGRKVWLCNDHLRIFDIEKSSYYGDNAKDSRRNSKLQAIRIIHSLENKLGLKLNPNKIKFRKEHYALIRNQLAIDQNEKSIIWRIKDEEGNEWLLIDDSLGEGGEIENIGKKAFKTNPKLQKYWNDIKNTNFKVTPTFILNTMNGIQQNQVMFDKNFQSHLEVINKLGNAVDKLTEEISKLKNDNKHI